MRRSPGSSSSTSAGGLDLGGQADALGRVHQLDVHGAEHQHDVVELIERDDVRGQGVVDLVVGEEALLLPSTISLSSSSSFGSSAMRCPPPDGVSGVHRGGHAAARHRRDAASSLTASRLPLEGSQLGLELRAARRVADGLGLAMAWRQLATRCLRRRISYRFWLDDVTCVSPTALLDQQGGQEPALGLVRSSAIRASGGQCRRIAAAPQERAEPGCATSRLRDGEELGPGVVDVQEEGQQIALEPGVRRAATPPPCAAGAGRHAATGRAPWSCCASIQSWVASTPRRRPPRATSVVASSALATLDSSSATRAWAVARPRGRAEVLLGERAVEDEGQQASARRRAAREAPRRLRPAGGCPDRGRRAAARP